MRLSHGGEEVVSRITKKLNVTSPRPYIHLHMIDSIAGWVSAFGHHVPILDRYRCIQVPDWVSLFRYRTGSDIGNFVHSGTGLTVRHLKKGYTLHAHTAGGRNGHTLDFHTAGSVKGHTLHDHTAGGGMERDMPCTSILLAVGKDTPWQLLMVLFLVYDIEKPMPECQKKVSPASAFLPVVGCLSPASAFRHKGSVRYRWSRISPALPSYGWFVLPERQYRLSLCITDCTMHLHHCLTCFDGGNCAIRILLLYF